MQSIRQSLRTAAAIRHPRKDESFCVANEPIGAPKTNPFHLSRGICQKMILRVTGDLDFTQEKFDAFNATPHRIEVNDVVIVHRDWDTGRWVIVSGIANLLSPRIYFKALGSFGQSDAQFPAQLVNALNGISPLGYRWSLSGSDVIYNPETTVGSHIFYGTTGVHGFATWHGEEEADPTAPVGYWCDFLQCSV